MSLSVGLKRALRPLAFRLRQTLDRAGRILRPPASWDGRHHPALLQFTPWEGRADGRFQYDFLGVKTDPRFRPQIRPDPPGPLKTGYPAPYAGYFELAFVLESLAEAACADRFTILELGAGYGPWMVTAHRARELTSAKPINLVGVEMVPRHYEWMHVHLTNNGIDPGRHRLIHAAVSDVDGEALYLPEENPWLDYGQSLIRRRRLEAEGEAPIPAEPARTTARDAETHGPVRVPAIELARLLRDQQRVDLMHADIQGEERRALPAAIDELNLRVHRLIVATHSNRIHRELRRLLAEAGWRIVFDFRCRKRERTAYGDVKFLDGLLACVNESRSRLH